MHLRDYKPALLLLTALTTLARAQTNVESNLPGATFNSPPPTQQQSSAPTLHVTARETVVDVLVTDSKGHPVHGLTQSDFTISEDGKPQPIRSFSETRKDSPPNSATASNPLPTLPPNTYTNRQPPPATGSTNIILLDALNVDPTDQMRARQHAATYFNAMPPGTQVALFSLGTGLKILQGFTSDPQTLVAAMDDKKNGMLVPTMPVCVKPELTLDALRQIAAFVAGIKGRKNLLWFTTGTFPLYDICDPDLERRTFDLLQSSQVAIDPIDVRGLVNPGAQDVSTGPDQMRITANTGPAYANATAGSYVGQSVRLLSMEALAERTGGIAYYNTNALDASIGSAIESGANYYTLSYVPPGQLYDGRHHTIHVTVNRSHLQLVYRTGYGADDPKEAEAITPIPTKLASTTPDPSANTMEASMARFAPTATQLIFDVKFAPTTTPPLPTDPPIMGFPVGAAKSRPMARYDILYSIPPDQVAFTTGPDGSRNGSVQFAVVATDVFGKLVTSISRTMQLPLSPGEYADFLHHPFQFLQQIDLPDGQTFVRVGILDQVSRNIGTIEIPLSVTGKETHPDVLYRR